MGYRLARRREGQLKIASDGADQLLVRGQFGRSGQTEAAVVQGGLLDVRQDVVDPAARLPLVESAVRIADPIPAPAAGRQVVLDVVMVMERQGKLPQLVLALRAAGRFASRLHGRQEQRHEHAHDRDHHEQLDEREGRSSAIFGRQFDIPHPAVSLR